MKTTATAYTVIQIGSGSTAVTIDRDDLAELLRLDLPLRWWSFHQGGVQVPLPGGAPIAVARLITEAPAGFRVRYLDRNPRNLRRANLSLRPFRQAKQDGKAAKALCVRLVELNRQMQQRGRTGEAA